MTISKTEWMNKQWRPAMAWVYSATIVMDFMIFPILWGILQAMTGAAITQWQPITLMYSGIYHFAMAGVLGISAYGRTKEKIAGVEGSGN